MRKVRTASRFVTSRTAALATGFVVFAGWLVFLQVAVDPPSEPLVVECKNNASVFDPSALPPLPAPRVHFVLVHAGKSQPPGHIYDCISHTRQLNPTRTVLVITDLPLADVQRLEHDEAATPGSLTFIRTPAEFAAWRLSLAGAASAPLPGVVNILIDAVPCSPEHLAMRRVERSQSNDRTSIEEGFWYNTLSRLFYVYDVVRAGGFTDVVHFEFDNLIYFEYEEIAAPLREAHTSFTSVPLGRKNELANVVWIRSAPALEPLMAFLGRPDQKGRSEMKRLRSFIEAHPGHVLRLPTSWTAGVTTQGSEAQFPLFRAVFDAAQIGQWAGGADPMHEEIRGYCCFQNTIGPYDFGPGGRHSLYWKPAADAGVSALRANALIPFIREDSTGGSHGGQAVNGSTSTSLDVRVMNLHVHSKTLWRFVRRRRSGSDFVDLAGSYVPAAVALRTTKVGNLGE